MTVWTPENAGEEAEDSHDTLPNGVSLADFYADRTHNLLSPLDGPSKQVMDEHFWPR